MRNDSRVHGVACENRRALRDRVDGDRRDGAPLLGSFKKLVARTKPRAPNFVHAWRTPTETVPWLSGSCLTSLCAQVLRRSRSIAKIFSLLQFQAITACPAHRQGATPINAWRSGHELPPLWLGQNWHTLCFSRASESVLPAPRRTPHAKCAKILGLGAPIGKRSFVFRSHFVGPEEFRMDSLYLHIALGLGILLLAIGLADGIRILLEPYFRTAFEIHKLEKRRAARPILLAEWNAPRA